MRTLLVHRSGLMYSEIFLRLEPLGAERSRTDLYIHTRPRHPASTAPQDG